MKRSDQKIVPNVFQNYPLDGVIWYSIMWTMTGHKVVYYITRLHLPYLKCQPTVGLVIQGLNS